MFLIWTNVKSKDCPFWCLPFYGKKIFKKRPIGSCVLSLYYGHIYPWKGDFLECNERAQCSSGWVRCQAWDIVWFLVHFLLVLKIILLHRWILHTDNLCQPHFHKKWDLIFWMEGGRGMSCLCKPTWVQWEWAQSQMSWVSYSKVPCFLVSRNFLFLDFSVTRFHFDSLAQEGHSGGFQWSFLLKHLIYFVCWKWVCSIWGVWERNKMMQRRQGWHDNSNNPHNTCDGVSLEGQILLLLGDLRVHDGRVVFVLRFLPILIQNRTWWWTCWLFSDYLICLKR